MSDATDTSAVPSSAPGAEPVPEGSPAAVSSRGRWPRPVVLGVVGGLAVGAAVVGTVWGLSGGGSSSPVSFTLRGSLSLTGSHTASGPTYEDCAGYEGYDDITKGASVTVYDSAGAVVATGALGTGKPQGAGCVFPVRVPDVPGGSKFYRVEVSHRGQITVTAVEAKAGEFAASLG